MAVLAKIWTYATPDGFADIVMSSDGEALTGLWFKGSRDDWRPKRGCERRELPVFTDTCRWLDEYFAGRAPGFTPKYRIDDATPFRLAVVDELLKIPYGATVSYGDIAKAVAKKRGGKVSARAVGGAVGWNPICIVIPCHRVVGANGDLTGYGGGLDNKISLLAHEGSDFFDVRLSAPKDAKSEPDEMLVRRALHIVGKAASSAGFGRPACDRSGGCATICIDALTWIDSPYIFGGLDDEEAKFLLESFIDFHALYQFGLSLQLARLLAERGALVRGRMGRIVAKTDWGSYTGNGLLLAYLGSVKGADAQIRRLLDIVPEDGRDGLFMACWMSRSVRVQKKLREKFEEWISRDSGFGGGTGEASWLAAFLAKWTRDETFGFDSLRPLVQWHLSRQTPQLMVQRRST